MSLPCFGPRFGCALAMAAILALGYEGLAAQCIPCHYCQFQEGVSLGVDGVSTVEVDGEPGQPCSDNCADHGAICDPAPFASAPVIDALQQGEQPSLTELVASAPDRLRYIPERSMVVVLSACDEEAWWAAFPVRPEEVPLARERLEPLSAT
jgi:hypothetical protein